MITHFKGNKSPSLTDVIKVNNTPFALTTSTVKFQMRLDTSATLKIDAAAVVTDAPNGAVRYDWQATDVDTAGHYICWWQVTLPSGFTQNTPSFVLVMSDQNPAQVTDYLQREEMKSTLTLAGQTFSDYDIDVAITAASRGIDEALSRRFYKDVDATSVRYYTPDDPWCLDIDDIVASPTPPTIQVDRDGNGTYEETWVRGTDYELGPRNAALDAKPYERIEVLRGSTNFGYLPTYAYAYPNIVKVTGQFGWPTVPIAVKELTSLVATRLLKRTREAPFGIVAFGVEGAAVRAASFASDPEYMFLAKAVDRTQVLV